MTSLERGQQGRHGQECVIVILDPLLMLFMLMKPAYEQALIDWLFDEFHGLLSKYLPNVDHRQFRKTGMGRRMRVMGRERSTGSTERRAAGTNQPL